MGGISYSELKAMDIYEFIEAEQARILWQTPEGRDDLWMRPAAYGTVSR